MPVLEIDCGVVLSQCSEHGRELSKACIHFVRYESLRKSVSTSWGTPCCEELLRFLRSGVHFIPKHHLNSALHTK